MNPLLVAIGALLIGCSLGWLSFVAAVVIVPELREDVRAWLANRI